MRGKGRRRCNGAQPGIGTNQEKLKMTYADHSRISGNGEGRVTRGQHTALAAPPSPTTAGSGASPRASMAFAGTPDQVRAARHWVRDMLDGHPALSDVTLVASELAANAIAHTASGRVGGVFLVTLQQVNGSVAVTVRDQGSPGSPSPRPPDGESGRGLTLVRALSTIFAVLGDSRSRTVVAVVPPPGERP